MGQLRDRMEGQAYYDRLKVDILAEYAFEKLIGLTKFDWKKREVKSYKRKQYLFNNTPLKLLAFSGQEYPKISIKHLSNFVLVYVNPEQRVYVSGVALRSDVENWILDIPFNLTLKSSIVDYTNFSGLLKFSSHNDINEIIEKRHITRAKKS